MIKYLGSKRRLVPLLSAIAQAVHARTAVDLFTGTTRVAQALRLNGTAVTAVDTARYAEVFAQTYVVWDPSPTELQELAATIAELASLPGEPGYVTDVFCSLARYFHPDNGRRIDAIREAIATDHAGTWREPPLLTSLLEAADRVDSTTGVQMAFLKQWAPRALAPLELRVPRPVTGPAGRAVRAEAGEVAATIGTFDLAYLDPPYNQHRYFTNYHVWETLVAWDRPPHYGVACKRLDARDPATASDFNRRRHMPAALRSCIDAVDARVVVVSYNDEAWLTLDELRGMLGSKGVPIVLAVDSKRYVGAQIGVHDPAGRRVGTVSHLRNTEYVIVAGDLSPPERRAVEQAGRHHGAVVIGEGAAMTRTAGP